MNYRLDSGWKQQFKVKTAMLNDGLLFISCLNTHFDGTHSLYIGSSTASEQLMYFNVDE